MSVIRMNMTPVTPVIRYTRMVTITKRLLLSLAVGMVGFIVWMATFTDDSARLALTPSQHSNDAQPIMLKPHYQGVDAKNRPFTVIADKGTQLDKDNVLLNHVQTDMTTENGAWMALRAGLGHMHTPDKQLQLTQGVDLFYEGGYEFRTDHAHVNVPAGSADGDAHVEGQGPAGTLKADSFSATNRGQILHFNGSVITTLYH